MRARASLLILLLTLLLSGCGTFNVEARLMTPAEGTATAQAALTPSPTSVTTYDKIIVVQRDRTASGLDEVMAHVTYPLLVPSNLPDGTKLTRVSELASEHTPHTTYFWYTLPDGREFSLSESETRPHQHQWEESELIGHLEIHGQPAVLYVPSSEGPAGEQVPSTRLALHWHEGQTGIVIFGELTQEEIVAIAGSMRKVEQ